MRGSESTGQLRIWRLTVLVLAVCAVLSACGLQTPSAAPTVVAPTELPSPALESAHDAIARYEELLAAGDWESAWAMVSAEQQRAWRSVSDFQAAESSFLRLYGTAFAIHPTIIDAGQVDSAAKGAGFTSVNALHSALVTVDRVPVRDNSAWETFIVGLEAGTPKIWQVR